MGTKADFYIGKGKDSEWIGSIAYDGYPDRLPKNIIHSHNEEYYRQCVIEFLNNRDDNTLPDKGWPWPWNDSNTTDYAYTFDGIKVVGSCFGSYWFDVANPPKEEKEDGESPIFPDMKDIKNVSFGKNSGLLIISAHSSL